MPQHHHIPLVFLLLAATPVVYANSSLLPDSSNVPDESGAAVAPDSGELSGAPVGSITINNGSIFDLDNPAEDKALYRIANRLHITTRPEVIESQLLFRSGDLYSPQEIEESARLLRSNRYLQDATIKPVLAADGSVNIDVTTTDVWTLMPKLDFSRSGGKNKAAIGVKEMNLLGTGMAVEVLYKSDVDRDSTSLRIVDRNIGRSRYAIRTRLASNSDGHNVFLQLGKPFYSLDSRDSKELLLRDDDQIESFYDRGERMSDYRHESSQLELGLGWSKGLRNGWTRRWSAGLAYEDHRFSDVTNSDYPSIIVPENRELVYPFVAFEWVEDRFETTRNHEQINVTEDRYLGTHVSGRLGYASEGFGSDRDALVVRAAAETGFGSSKADSLILGTYLDGRIETGDVRNLTLGIRAQYYRRQSEHRLLYAGLLGTFGQDLDLDQQLLVGGDTGLRGYPLRYQAGDKRALLTIEQRFFSDWYPFRLFHVGGAVFFDMGRAWGETPVSTSQNDWLRDVGFGLRLGSSRSGLGRIIHIDVAYPLDGDDSIADVQFLISTSKSF